MTTVGKRVKKIRVEHNLSQQEFGYQIKLGQSRLSEIEKGKTKPSYSTLLSIMKHFHVSLDWLFSGEGEPYQHQVTIPNVYSDAITQAEVEILTKYRQLSKYEQHCIHDYIEWRYDRLLQHSK